MICEWLHLPQQGGSPINWECLDALQHGCKPINWECLDSCLHGRRTINREWLDPPQHGGGPIYWEWLDPPQHGGSLTLGIYNLVQVINKPSRRCGHIIDWVIVRPDDDIHETSTAIDSLKSDHYCTKSYFNVAVSRPTTSYRTVRNIANIDRPSFIDEVSSVSEVSSVEKAK